MEYRNNFQGIMRNIMTQNSKKTEKKKGFQNEDQKKNINKNGRPRKGMAMSDILKEYLDEDGAKDKTRKEILIEKLYKMATNEDIAALKYIMDRVLGKPKEQIETDNKTDLNIKIEWE